MLHATILGDAFSSKANEWGLTKVAADAPIPLPLGKFSNDTCASVPPSNLDPQSDEWRNWGRGQLHFFPESGLGCFTVRKMPVPQGAQIFQTPQGYGIIAIVPTAAQIEILNKDIARIRGEKRDPKYQAQMEENVRQMEAGIRPRYMVRNYWQRVNVPNIYVGNAATEKPPADRPQVVNPDTIAAAGSQPGEYVYDMWGLFYGPATRGRILYINIPVFQKDFDIGIVLNAMFNPFSDPFKKIGGVIGVVGSLIKDVKEVVDDIMNEILPCDSSVSDLVAKGFSQYGAQFFHAMRCAGTGPCPPPPGGGPPLPRNAQGLCNDPCIVRGMAMDPFTGNCIPTTPTSDLSLGAILPWLLGGAAAIGLALYIRRSREEEE